jgi:predicted transcriptional regulator
MSRITQCLVKVFNALESSSQWLSVDEIALLSEVNYNTAKAHVRNLCRNRILEKIEMHPANLYKISDHAANDELVTEIKKVAKALSKHEGLSHSGL